jgi:iron(III)-salmochelin esterase
VLRRRSFVLGSLLGLACSKKEQARPTPTTPSTLPYPIPTPVTSIEAPDGAAPTPPPRGQIAMTTWTFGDGRAAVLVPAWTKPDEKLPLLFALHGRGEAMKGPVEGVMGWPRDYALVRAIKRVCEPPLATDDFEGFVDADRLQAHNDALAKRPFGGLVVVCPYSPDVDLRKPPQVKDYAEYVTKVVLPRAKKELPVVGTPASIGIDGVSLGGALALRIGLGNPDLFGAVGTLQAAIGEDQVPEFTDLAKAARAKNPRLSLRLLTSKDDYFRNAIKSASQSWKAAGIAHDFENVPGPHDYPFNRGPGAIEMLLWHDRVLARET